MRAGNVKKHRATRGRRGMRLWSKLRSFDWMTIVSLIFLFPYGIQRMWRARCNWPTTLKYVVSSAYLAAAVAFVLMMTLPVRTVRGGVELCGADVEVEIYGPELPTSIVEGYTKVATNSGVLSAADDDSDADDSIYVYAAEDAKCYHTWKCKFAFASSRRITPYEAYFLGYKPCNLCNPPVYGTTDGIEAAN